MARAPNCWPFGKFLNILPDRAHEGEMIEEILTVREVAKFLKVTERTIYRLATEGQIPSFKVGGSWRFQRSDLIQWMNDHAKGQIVRDSQPDGEKD
ncbi:helix-turn-helix domain-containing protein [Erythrobacter sp. WG]|uniref:helix-turn-helix domain-containing protein n=1 Tax=Erythrobacter sp. WG TaxID=2985510 RepID=UPI00226F75B4|nr:helix-turn-helix domain-containing protein [Erythrobacter sp. WG]